MAMRRRAATTKNADEATVHAVETAGPKRGRSTHKDDDKLPTKRSRKACADEGAGASGDALTEIVGVTSAMGLRPSRDAHPGLPARPRPRRTPTEVAAKRTEQEAAATQKRAAETQRRNNLALILATDDTIAENEKRKTVRHQSELVEDDEGRAIADDGPAGDGNNQEAAAEGETKEMLKVSGFSETLFTKLISCSAGKEKGKGEECSSRRSR